MNNVKISTLVGAKLKGLRVSKGYKIHDIATLIDKSDQQLFRYEKGINKIDLDTIVKYLNALHIDVTDFISSFQFEINSSD